MNLQQLFEQAILHQKEHGCSAHPYENYQRLFSVVTEQKPRRILEIGTGIGFTAVVMAMASELSLVDSLEKDPEHFQQAQRFISEQGYSARITLHNEIAEEFLPKLTEPYDLIFFDGFQIHAEFMPQYLRLLKVGGILVLGNNHLTSKTSDQFFKELSDGARWQILEKFADTTIARKL